MYLACYTQTLSLTLGFFTFWNYLLKVSPTWYPKRPVTWLQVLLLNISPSLSRHEVYFVIFASVFPPQTSFVCPVLYSHLILFIL